MTTPPPSRRCPTPWQLKLVAEAAAGYDQSEPQWYVAPRTPDGDVRGPYYTEADALAASAVSPGSEVVGPVCSPSGGENKGVGPARIVRLINGSGTELAQFDLNEVDALVFGIGAYRKFFSPYYASTRGLETALKFEKDADRIMRANLTGPPIVLHRIHSGQQPL